MELFEIRVTAVVKDLKNRDELYERIRQCLSSITNEYREDEGIVKIVNVGMAPDSSPRIVKKESQSNA